MPDFKTGGDAASGERFADDEANAIKNHFYGAAAPANAVAGVIWIDSGDDRVYRYDGADWDLLVIPIEENWTPAIVFGGAAVGVTYDAANTLGRYQRVGNWVHYTGRLVLTSKGSSNGNAQITPLPFTTKNYAGSYAVFNLYLNKVTFADQWFGFCSPNTVDLNLYEQTMAGVQTNLTDADFADDSVVMFGGAQEIEV